MAVHPFGFHWRENSMNPMSFHFVKSTLQPDEPKKRESGWLPFLFAVAMGEMCDGGWIPAFAGMTSGFTGSGALNEHRPGVLPECHSREGGNPCFMFSNIPV
jgi:hypothetical protein